MTSAQQQRDEAAQRLDRIEEKIDKMSEAIVSLARAEEKIMSMEKFLHQQSDQLIELTKRVNSVEDVVASRTIFYIIIYKDLSNLLANF